MTRFGWGGGSCVSIRYNSRGNPQSRCFLGYYFDATGLAAGAHDLAIWLPRLNGTSELLGAFWYGLRNEYTAEVVGPKPAGDLATCAATAAATPSGGATPVAGSENDGALATVESVA